MTIEFRGFEWTTRYFRWASGCGLFLTRSPSFALHFYHRQIKKKYPFVYLKDSSVLNVLLIICNPPIQYHLPNSIFNSMMCPHMCQFLPSSTFTYLGKNAQRIPAHSAHISLHNSPSLFPPLALCLNLLPPTVLFRQICPIWGNWMPCANFRWQMPTFANLHEWILWHKLGGGSWTKKSCKFRQHAKLRGPMA
jgi:hypothetical protein